MRIPIRLSGAPLVLAALFALPAAAEDLTIVFKETGKGDAGTSTQYFTPERMRMSAGDADTIVEYASGRTVTVDHKKKEYYELSAAEMQAIQARMQAEMEKANAQMAEAMKNMPPAMKDKMQGMMGGVAAAVTVTKGGTRKVAGYDTQQYTVAMGESMKLEMWTTTALQLPIPAAELRKWMSFGGSMANNPMLKSMSKMFDEMKKVQGLTLAETTSFSMLGKTITTSREAVEVKKGAIPASTFDVAAVAKGYKKVESPLAKALAQPRK